MTSYLLLAEGFSADPHHGKTMRGVLRYRRDDVAAPVAQHAARRLAVVRVGGEPLSEDQISGV